MRLSSYALSYIAKRHSFLNNQKKLPVFFVLILLIIALPIMVITLQLKETNRDAIAAGPNLLQNGSFENTGDTWLSPWNFRINSTGGGTITQDSTTSSDGSSSALINITNSANYWDVQLGQEVPLTAGQTYTISFYAKAATNRTIGITLQQDVSPYTEYYTQNVTLSTSWQQYNYTFTPSVTDTNTNLWFNVAQTTGQVWFDSVSLSDNSSPALGQQFYVDSIEGSDTNNGTSESSPWKTIGKVNSMTFAAGSTINFKRGSVWNQKLLVKSNGAQNNPIIYQAYGTGTAPTIDLSSGDAIDISGSYNVVKDFLLQNIPHYAIYVHADHNVVSDNEITNSGIGVWITGQYNLITRNNAHDLKMIVNTPGGDDDYGAAGYELNNAHNTEISYNKCINCKAPSFDYGTDGGFVEVWQNATNNIIHHNLASNTNGFFEIGGDNSSQVVSNNKIYYNKVLNTGAILVVHDSGTFSITPSNIIYENNTFYNSSQIWFASGEPSPSKLTFRNNILSGGSVGSNGNFTHTNNLYAASPGYTLGSGEKIGDPLFVNPNAQDLHLQASSPAIDAGLNLGYTLDFDNYIVPAGLAPDMGAFEYGSTPSQPSSTPTTETPTNTPAPTNTTMPTPTNTPTPTSTPTPQPTLTPTPLPNMIQNGSFETTGTNWLSPWTFTVASGARGSISKNTSAQSGLYSARITVSRANSNSWYVQLGQSNLQFTAGRTYQISFYAKASSARTMQWGLQQNHTPWNWYLLQPVNLTTNWKQFTASFTPTTSDTNVRLNFNVANATPTVYIDNVSIK